MLELRPDLCAALYEHLWRSRFGEEDATNNSSYPLPVWGVRDGKFTSHYSRTYIEAAQRRPEGEVPRVSDSQSSKSCAIRSSVSVTSGWCISRAIRRACSACSR
jgi:hypothetical protein